MNDTINHKDRWIWKVVYKIYPPILRLLEKARAHSFRQNYLIGLMKSDRSLAEFEAFLRTQEYENAILAWRDPGEVLSMRKLDQVIFQFHIRLFSDGEIRAHYEYASEGNPWGHVTEKVFEERRDYFEKLLADFLAR